MDAFRELPALSEEMDLGNEATLGRMAHVVEVNGHLVRLKLPEDSASGGPAWYPATVTGLTTGAYGVLVPTRGNGAFFVPMGQGATTAGDARYLLAAMRPGLAANTNNTMFSTTSIATDIVAIEKAFTLPAGSWRVLVDASGIVARSVNSGAKLLSVGLIPPAGSSVTQEGQHYQHIYDLDLTMGHTMRAACTFAATSPGGTYTARLMYRGETTAGTTTIRDSALTATWMPV